MILSFKQTSRFESTAKTHGNIKYLWESPELNQQLSSPKVYRWCRRNPTGLLHKAPYRVFLFLDAWMPRSSRITQAPAFPPTFGVCPHSSPSAQRGTNGGERDGRHDGQGRSIVSDQSPNEAPLRQASLAHLKRKASKARSRGIRRLIQQSMSLRASYALRKKIGFRPALKKERKVLPFRYYQLHTGHAITAPYLKEKLHKRDSDESWFCLSGKRQTREHLFKECDQWLLQIRALWRSAEKVLGWKHRGWRWRSVAELFREETATPHILLFLRDTKVGQSVAEGDESLSSSESGEVSEGGG